MKLNQKIELVIFDFGGVLAEEGFRNGLFAIAEKGGLDPQRFYTAAADYIRTTGYLTGQTDETIFWKTLRSKLGIQGSDQELRHEILKRFELRQWMIGFIIQLREMRVRTALLSDQTNWLDELDAAYGFFKCFDRVFNSYSLNKSKHDASVFDEVLQCMQVNSDSALFIDDTEGHVQRAQQRGLHTILYTDQESFLQDMQVYFPEIGISPNSSVAE